ncbi:hypothetical protein NQ318_003187 [Aromia moschata]|uniref:Uncharacterized protein n=1 Tax=Aromia moschata TaxID=1265417 RepID=A0AAV8YI60_9CUCU|nr:hypothetical protein NQ318_003187 [Aromia moschata]
MIHHTPEYNASIQHNSSTCAGRNIREDDYDKKVEYCEQILRDLTAAIGLQKILARCGRCVPKDPKGPKNIRAGIIGDKIIGLLFLEESLNGENHFTLIQNLITPSLRNLYPNRRNPAIPADTIWFQQDGVPPHYHTKAVRVTNKVTRP